MNKIPYKIFEKLCDLQKQLANSWNDKNKYTKTEQDIETLKDKYGWPYSASKEQVDDWNNLCKRLDSYVGYEKTLVCENCGYYPIIVNGCSVCGAPVCCPKCCEETTRQFFAKE